MVRDTGCLSITQSLISDKPSGKALQGLTRGLSLEDMDSGHTGATKDNSLLHNGVSND